MYLRERLGVRDIQTVADGKTDYADLPDWRRSVRVTAAFQDYGGDDRSRYSDGSAMSTAPAAVFTPARVRAWRGLMIDVRVERRRRRRAQRSDCRRGGDLHRSIDVPRPCPDPNRLDHPRGVLRRHGTNLPDDWTFGLGNKDYLAPTGRTMKESAFHRPSRSVFTTGEVAQDRDSAMGMPW